jgi:hypothetical protein
MPGKLQYVAQPAQATRDQVCRNITVCGMNQKEMTPPSPNSDRACKCRWACRKQGNGRVGSRGKQLFEEIRVQEGGGKGSRAACRDAWPDFAVLVLALDYAVIVNDGQAEQELKLNIIAAVQTIAKVASPRPSLPQAATSSQPTHEGGWPLP